MKAGARARRRRRQGAEHRRLLVVVAEPWRRFQVGITLLVAVLLVGTAGYVVIGLSPFDALYQTGITITTVGYAEIGPPDRIDGWYRAFTLVIVLVGASTGLYIVSVLLETLVEGRLNDGFRRRRMQKQADRMDGHLIVAGYGRVGRAICNHAARSGTPTVVVDQVAFPEDDPPMVVGDANADDTLLAAGIERASSLVAALGSDTENLSLTLTARSLRSDLLIVARVDDQRNERKFIRAGADRVVNPYEIGGSRMGAIALQPHATQFFEQVLVDETYDTELHELTVGAGFPLAGTRLGDTIGRDDQPLVIALRSADGSYRTNPPSATRLTEGDTLVVLGTKAQLQQLTRQAAGNG